MTTAAKMHWVTSVIFGTIFVILGLVGNTISILIWRRASMKSSTGVYLIAQAVADSGLLIFFFVTDSIKMMDPKIAEIPSYGVFFSYIGYPLFFLCVVCSIWITVGVTVDRYIQICWISSAKKMCNEMRAYLGIAIIVVLCFIVNLPHFWTFHPVDNRASNTSGVTYPAGRSFDKTEFGAGAGSINYEFWVHCIVLVLVPFFSIFAMNMLIIMRITNMNRKMDKKRSQKAKDKSRKSQTEITRILLTVTFAFLILIGMQCVTQCFVMRPDAAGNRETIDEAWSIAKLGIVINSSVNFILYCISGRRFRKELRAVLAPIFPCIKPKRAEDESTSLRTTDSSNLSKTKSSTASEI